VKATFFFFNQTFLTFRANLDEICHLYVISLHEKTHSQCRLIGNKDGYKCWLKKNFWMEL